ncbi:class I SAM-dependent methyltransferase [Candidatus Woesearchaeota archaeon]|nr:class I SAM-dependent methyltransferase [Candidatus Woesearchaeota archaeon]
MEAPLMHTHYAKLIKYQDTDFRSKNIRRLILKYVQPGSVLEVGCGTGHLDLELLKRGHEVFATDGSRKMIAYTKRTCRKYGKQLQTIVLPGNQLNRIKQKFDNIISIDVLEHIENDRDVLKQMHALLKEHGRVIILVPTWKVLYGIRDKEMGHYRRYGKKELQNKLREAGFEIQKTRYWNILGVLPYFISERILQKRINENIRYERTPFKSFMNKLLDFWFLLIENSISFPLGLSLLVIAKKI